MIPLQKIGVSLWGHPVSTEEVTDSDLIDDLFNRPDGIPVNNLNP
ncbi:MAG: hypothetical protein P8X79_04905 [Reinekea sp.]